MSASASGSSTQTPYIGSKISLISNSEIRYEGILYTVNTDDSTIALSKVKSFGTETRPTEHPVPARDETYEYIIFKASDIKDLIVCETPKPVPQMTSGLPYDPAIVSVSQKNQGGNENMQQQRGLSPQAAIDREHGMQTSRQPLMNAQQHSQRGGFSHQHHQGARGGPGMVTRQFHRGGGQQHQAANGGQSAAMSYRNAAMTGISRGGHSNGMAPGPPPPHRGGHPGFRGGSVMPHFPPPPHHMQRGGGPMGHRPPRGMFVNRGGRGGSGAAGRPVIKFDSDFDWEESNTQFKEELTKLNDELGKAKISADGDSVEGAGRNEEDSEEEETETLDEHDPDDSAGFYDKTRSFFDGISCEALERQEGKNQRPNWKREREVNTETFGTSALRTYNYMRGGRGFNRGGYGNRGGFRGAPRGNFFQRGAAAGQQRGGGYQQQRNYY